jgi:hypothetical protein
MGYIANIVTKSKLNVGSFFNVTSNFKSIDDSKPTLIIGWSEVKELFPEQDILNSYINENISWTFSKREKRYKYEKDLEEFINKSVRNLNNIVNYRFFNFILASSEKRESFLNYVQNGNCSIYYNSRFLYVFSSNDNMTFGISLNDLRYVGLDVKNFIKTLNSNNNNLIIDNLSFIEDDSLSLIRDNTKIVAYLNYLKNSNIYKEKINNG